MVGLHRQCMDNSASGVNLPVEDDERRAGSRSRSPRAWGRGTGTCALCETPGQWLSPTLPGWCRTCYFAKEIVRMLGSGPPLTREVRQRLGDQLSGPYTEIRAIYESR